MSSSRLTVHETAPELFLPISNIDRRTRNRTLFTNVRHCAMWNEAMDAKFRGHGEPFTRADRDQLLGHCSAVSSDPPAMAFAEDLIRAYPDAKVVLVERDIESWYRSFDVKRERTSVGQSDQLRRGVPSVSPAASSGLPSSVG